MAGGPGAISMATSYKAIASSHVHQSDRLVREMMASAHNKHNSSCVQAQDSIYDNCSLLRLPFRRRKLLCIQDLK